MLSVETLMRKYYRGHKNPFDQFTDEARRITHFGDVVFHAGCGADSSIGFRSLAKLTIGMDYNAWVARNSDLDHAMIGDLTYLPLRDESVDLVAARWVMEHLESPRLFLQEVVRILRPGGRLIVLTPNLWNYAPFITKIMPFWFQKWFVRNLLHREPDVFLIFYRANTRHNLRALAAQSGLKEEQLYMIDGAPSLLGFWSITFLMGTLYERLIMSSEVFSNFRADIFAVFSKS